MIFLTGHLDLLSPWLPPSPPKLPIFGLSLIQVCQIILSTLNLSILAAINHSTSSSDVVFGCLNSLSLQACIKDLQFVISTLTLTRSRQSITVIIIWPRYFPVSLLGWKLGLISKTLSLSTNLMTLHLNYHHPSLFFFD